AIAVSFRPISFQFTSRASDALGAGWSAAPFFGVSCGVTKTLAANITAARKWALFIRVFLRIICDCTYYSNGPDRKTTVSSDLDVRRGQTHFCVNWSADQPTTTLISVGFACSERVIKNV